MASLLDALAARAVDEPDALALLTEHDGTRTFSELADNAAAIGNGLLRELDLSAGEAVCLLMGNHPAWIETYLGAAAASLVPVALDPTWPDGDLIYALGHARVVALLTDRNGAERVLAMSNQLPALRHVVAVDLDGAGVPAGAVAHRDLVTSDHPDLGDVIGSNRHRPAGGMQVMFTSGTSAGRPKAVVTGLGARGGTDYREMFGLSYRDRALVVTPFCHNNGLGGVTVALAHGASAVFPRRFSASTFWPLVDRYRPTYLFTVAPVVNILLSRDPGPWEKRHNLRVAVVAAGGAASASTVESRLGARVLDMYGMTEALGSGTYNRLDDAPKPGSAGRRAPGSTMSIVRPDGSPASPGEIGEVVFDRESIVFTGYLEDDDATDAVLDDRHFHSGDLGYFDEDGYFYFVERMKDVVRRGGENIWSTEVEEVLRGCEGVADAAVVGKPDDVLGETVVAFVVSLDPDSCGEAALRQHAQERLAPYKVPEAIILVDELPRTATGKVIKQLLRSRL